ncbi:MAG: FAD-dependent oxidoreductase [Rubricoccaceae bacterium]
MRLAVIGGLAAGPAAAAEAARQNPAADVVLFEQTAHVSVGACEIPYYVADRLGGRRDLIALTPDELARTRGLTVHVRHRVTALDAARGRLTVEALDHGATREERFDRFILATGARPRRLGVEGEDAAGVFAVRGYDDAVAVRRWVEVEPVRHAVVVGGGYVGAEMAEAFRDRGLQVTVLEPQGRLLAGALDEALGQPLAARARARGVRVRPERPTRLLTAPDGRVRAVVTDRGERIGCQVVLVAIGVEPNVDLARGAGVRIGDSGAVATDAQMRTSARAVWACGDCAEVTRVVDGRRLHWPLAPATRQTARVAARNAARDARHGGAAPPATFQGVTGAVGVRVFGIEAAAVGLREHEAAEAGFDALAVQVQHVSRTRVYPGAKPLWVRLVVEAGTGRLLGGQLVGEEGAALRADVLVPLVRAGISARVLAEDIDLIYNPPLAPATDPLRVAAAAAMRACGQRRPRA